MAFVLVILAVLNMVQLNKDGVRCKKSDYKESGCSIFVKK